MDTQSTSTQPFNLQARVVNILTKPKQEWPVIAAEPRDVTGLYSKYIAILAAIGPICTAIGYSVIGLGFGIRWGFTSAIVMAVFTYIVALVAVYLAAFIVARLGPTFQSDSDVAQALKLVAYSETAVWVAGVLYILPLLGILALLAWLYSLYLMYLGMTPVMKTPSEKVIPYMVVSIVVTFLVSLVLGAIAMAFIATMGLGAAITRSVY